MKLIFTLFTALQFTFPVFSQIEHQWSFGIGSKAGDGAGTSGVDHLGNVYVLLEMLDSVDVDPGPAVDLVVPEGGISLTLAKFDPNGNLIYAYPFFLATDSYGSVTEVRHNQIQMNLYFTDSLVYERNGVREKLFDQPGYHFAILTADLDGKIIKSHYVNVPNNFWTITTYTFPDGKMLIGGAISDTIIINPQSPVKLISKGNSDAYMMLVDSDFMPIWYNQIEGTNYSYITAFTVGKDNRIYFSGSFKDTIHINTVGGSLELISSGDKDAFFGSMSMSGTIEKVFVLQGPAYEEIRDIEPDDEGGVFICGNFKQTLNFAHPSQPPHYGISAGSENGFISHYDENGKLVWLGLFPCIGYDGVHNIELKRGNELYLSGSFTQKADLNPGPDSMIVTTSPQSAPFVTKLTTAGEFLWSIPFQTNHLAGIRSIHVLTEYSRVVITGFYNNSLHLGTVPEENWLDTEYGSDWFIGSYTEENVTTAIHDPSFSSPLEILNLFPNPAIDNITVSSESELNNISLYNSSGTLIYQENSIQTNQVEIKLFGLPSGLYYITTTSADKLLTGKFIKE